MWMAGMVRTEMNQTFTSVRCARSNSNSADKAKRIMLRCGRAIVLVQEKGGSVMENRFQRLIERSPKSVSAPKKLEQSSMS